MFEIKSCDVAAAAAIGGAAGAVGGAAGTVTVLVQTKEDTTN